MAKKNDIFGDIIKLIDNEYAAIADDGFYSDISSYIDTGSYALNALYSGSIYKGLPDNKVSALAGEEATGKTYFLLGLIKHFLDSDDKAIVVFFESEGALTKDILQQRGVDTKRVLIVPVNTISDFKTQATRILEKYSEKSDEKKTKLFVALDSLGHLSTTKEMEDAESGKNVRDMTRQQELKSAFRVLTLKLSKANVPMVITNHTYQSVGLYATKEMSGGSGLKYAATNIMFLSKSKLREGTDVIGAIIKCRTKKSRITKEGAEVSVKLTFDQGLDRYYGLVDIAIAAGIFKKVSTKVELPCGKTAFEKSIYKKPQKYFTPEILDQIDKSCQKIFLYGMPDVEQITESILNEPE